MKPERKFMEAAIEEAKEISKRSEYPIGAVMVKDGRIISRGRSLASIENDATLHAEVDAIRKASKELGSFHIKGCVLYSTLEPCPMCAAAAVWAKVDHVVFGATLEDAIEFSKSVKDKNISLSYRQIRMKCSEVLSRSETKVGLVEGFMRDECVKLFSLSR